MHQKVTYQNGQYETICGSVLPGINTICTQLVTKSNLYVIYPELKQCCRCCNSVSGCGVKNPNWLAWYSFQGEENLSG